MTFVSARGPLVSVTAGGKGKPNPRNCDRRGSLLAPVHNQIPKEFGPGKRDLFQKLVPIRGKGDG